MPQQSPACDFVTTVMALPALESTPTEMVF